MTQRDFWKTKSLTQMSPGEWDALCDGCGLCCLHKLEDIDSGEFVYTEVACHLLDLGNCRCTRYADRRRLVPDCVVLTVDRLAEFRWLPPTCAYRLLAEGEELRWWHPLVSGDPGTVHEAGISVRGRSVSEHKAGDLLDHIVDWPGE